MRREEGWEGGGYGDLTLQGGPVECIERGLAAWGAIMGDQRQR